MAMTGAPSRLPPYAEELLDNDHARENLREGAEELPPLQSKSCLC